MAATSIEPAPEHGSTWCEDHSLLCSIFGFKQAPASELHSREGAARLAGVFSTFTESLQVSPRGELLA